MRKIFFFLLTAGFVATTSCNDNETDPHAAFEWTFDSAHAQVAQYVDPMIGTGGHGHTFPGACAPFGMVQLSPDTRVDGSWDGCSGYHHDDDTIYGFSHTHLSGTGCSDYGDIMLMPGINEPAYTNGFNSADNSRGYAQPFKHEDETAEAGYYSVKLGNGIQCELTASPRVGVHRYHFGGGENPWIILDMTHRDEVLACELEILDDRTIRGKRFSKAWATNQQLWFYAEFSEPFTHTLWSDGKTFEADSSSAKDLRAVFSFDASSVEVKVALSPVSWDNAKLNLQVETAGMDFDAVRKKTLQHWDSELSRIEIETDSVRKKTIFYTALYHCFIAPNVYCDVNGEYQGMDHKVYRDTVHQRYTVFSLWDTYRALHPLFTIVQQERTNDFINTFLQHYKESGRLPVWELSSNETDCMIGYHSVPVIADAWLKGITGYDTALAYEAMKASAMGDRYGLAAYRNYGFIPAEDESESVSRTLEYAFDDWCIAQIASRMNRDEEAQAFHERSASWRNLFDPETGFLRARLNNSFLDPFRADEVNFHYTEANAWQYSMAVQHAIPELAYAHHGGERFEPFLDSLFSVSSSTTGREQADITGLIGQYAQGNEPSHHMAYLYNYAGHPFKTQQIITKITSELYTEAADGLCGNEDCGQMSAWYVLSSMGIYPVNPCGGRFDYGLPQFDMITVHLENEKDLKISCSGPVQVADGRVPYPGTTFAQLCAGGELRIPVYADTLCVYSNAPAYESGIYRVPAPVIVSDGSRTFVDRKTIAIKSLYHGTEIYYSVNGSQFTKYKAPVTLDADAEIRTYETVSPMSSYLANQSDTVIARFTKAPAWKSIAIRNAYAPQYAAGGDRALIDGLKGTEDFRTGLWQGYEGVDLEVMIDLGKEMDVDSVKLNFLVDQKSWIFRPTGMAMYVSNDTTTMGQGVYLVYDDNGLRTQPASPYVDRVTMGIGKKGRYLKLVVNSQKICPDGHPGAGKPAWLFCDEITVVHK